MVKSYAVLCMYDALNSGRDIRLEESCNKYGISAPTFRRYISLLRAFLMEKRGQELVYEK